MKQRDRLRTRDDRRNARVLQYLRHRRRPNVIAAGQQVPAPNRIRTFRRERRQHIHLRIIIRVGDDAAVFGMHARRQRDTVHLG